MPRTSMVSKRSRYAAATQFTYVQSQRTAQHRSEIDEEAAMTGTGWRAVTYPAAAERGAYRG